MAHFEAASVPAFEGLARELEAHGAPKRLQRAALRASRDEVRHARIATALAEREGASVPKARVRKGVVRSLVAVALENAVEGCVNETFAAAVAVAQSMTASDARVRAAMGRIARDELRHAELAWSVARWIEGRLGEGDIARVARARTAAVEALLRRTTSDVHPELVKKLGLPPAPVARAIALEMRELWWRPPRFSSPSSSPASVPSSAKRGRQEAGRVLTARAGTGRGRTAPRRSTRG
jgi:hypothetical protein